MPYYTRAGDEGGTYICDRQRASKASARVAAYGEVDELNAAIGLARAACRDRKIDIVLERLQKELFMLGSDLATPLDSKFKIARITGEHTKKMEGEIDRIAKDIGELRNFILPGGSELAARLHLARAVCRRTERAIIRLANEEKINPDILPFINRLSSLLFVLARLANRKAKVKEAEWKAVC